MTTRLTRLWNRLINLGFRLLYNELAFTYDVVSWIVSLGAWRCWVGTSLKYLSGQSPVLELAHGTGNLQLDLHAAGYRTIGYDLSSAMGKVASAKLKRHGVTLRLTRGKAEQLPFASNSFAAVVSTFPTDFILAPETIREVYRVLRPDGMFVIVPNAVLVGGGVIGKMLEWLYTVTGQRGGVSNREAIALLFAPFEIDITEEKCPRSVVTVIIGRKAKIEGDSMPDDC
ncbi:MAG TPA: class I SAM-dependent methyltransferase [Phototrophicaceae bacterium]|nr:class I SAM-dependent methyltransferase [Phototrophicaceae bacterium]